MRSLPRTRLTLRTARAQQASPAPPSTGPTTATQASAASANQATPADPAPPVRQVAPPSGGRSEATWGPTSLDVGALYLDLRPQLHHAVRRQAQVIRRRRRVAVHACKELLAPARHAAADGRDDDVARQEVRSLHVVELEAAVVQKRQRLRHVGFVLEAEVQRHLPAVVAQRL